MNSKQLFVSVENIRSRVISMINKYQAVALLWNANSKNNGNDKKYYYKLHTMVSTEMNKLCKTHFETTKISHNKKYKPQKFYS